MECPNCGNTLVHTETIPASTIPSVEIHICRSCGSTLVCHAPDDQMSESGKRLWAVVSAISTGTPRRDAVRAVYGMETDDRLDE